MNENEEDFSAMSQEQTNSVQMCLDSDGDKKRMRELLTRIAEKEFASISNQMDPEAKIVSQYSVGGLVRRTCKGNWTTFLCLGQTSN